MSNAKLTAEQMLQDISGVIDNPDAYPHSALQMINEQIKAFLVGAPARESQLSALQADAQRKEDAAIRGFAKSILHGNHAHQMWLLAEAELFIGKNAALSVGQQG